MQMTASSFWLPGWLGGRATRCRSLPLIRRHGPFLTGVPARYSFHAARSTQCCPMPSSVCARTGSMHMDSPWLLLHGGACPKEPQKCYLDENGSRRDYGVFQRFTRV